MWSSQYSHQKHGDPRTPPSGFNLVFGIMQVDRTKGGIFTVEG